MTILGNTWRILQLSRPTLQSKTISPMSNKSHSRLARRMDRSEIERQELAGAIRRALPGDGRVEMQPGLTLFRVSAPTEPVYRQYFISLENMKTFSPTPPDLSVPGGRATGVTGTPQLLSRRFDFRKTSNRARGASIDQLLPAPI